MRVLIIQLDTIWLKKEDNHTKILRFLKNTDVRENDLIVLPEMFDTGFCMDKKLIDKSFDVNSEKYLVDLCKIFKIYCVAGIAVKDENTSLSNQALCINPEGEVLSRYKKIHPFSYSGEDKVYESGSEVLTFKWRDKVTLSPFICYDIRFPEIFRIASKKNRPEVFIVIANWPAKRVDVWESILKVRAIENQAFVVGVNRCGVDPNVNYNGQSIIFGPKGDVKFKANDLEGVHVQELDMKEVLEWRKAFPALDDLKMI